MAAKKKGWMTRLIEGSEKSESYARGTLPSNRWELFWDIFKGRLSKLFIINLMVLIFMLPLFLLLLAKTSILNMEANLQPFSQNLLMGYPAVPDLAGVAQSVTLNINKQFFLLIPFLSLVFSVGLAGGFYVIRNMVWTEGIFVANDFWRGIKLNYFTILKTAFVYTLVLFISIYSLAAIDLMLVRTAFPKWMLIIAKGSTYLLLIISTLMALFMCTMGVTYELGFFKLLKNAFLITIGLLPQNLFFAFVSALPLLLIMFGGFFTSLGYMLLIMIGLSFIMLVWTNYSHWVFDRFINDKVEGAIKNRGLYEKIDKKDSAAVVQYKKQIEQLSVSNLTARPIKPINDKELQLAELPSNYSRKHLQMLKESKEKITADHNEYIEKHKSQPKYREMEELLKQQELEKQEKEQEKSKNTKSKDNAKK